MKKIEHHGPAPGELIKVLMADDHLLFRRSLRALLEMDNAIEVVGEAKNGHEAIAMNLLLHPDLIIMDIGMPQLDGLSATRKIIEMSPTIKVLMFSSYPDPEYIRQAMDVGASGYLIKQSSASILNVAIHEAVKGRAYFSPSIPKRLQDECQKVFDKRESLKKQQSSD